MSKYDQLNYLTRSEKENHCLPKCIKNVNRDDIEVPEELLGIPIQNFKNYLNIKTPDDEIKFQFANNNQTSINEYYFKNGKFFSDKMEKDQKREFLLDYIKFFFGNEIDGKVFEEHLQDIFHLRKYELIDEDFDVMIEDYFKKKVINLDDPEDRKKFKNIIFHQYIKYLNEEEAKKFISESQNNIDEESNSRESKGSKVSEN